jgi:hypothetical protein
MNPLLFPTIIIVQLELWQKENTLKGQGCGLRNKYRRMRHLGPSNQGNSCPGQQGSVNRSPGRVLAGDVVLTHIAQSLVLPLFQQTEPEARSHKRGR